MARVAGAHAAVGELAVEVDALPPVPGVPRFPAANPRRHVRQAAIIAALCLGGWIAWTVAQGVPGTPFPEPVSDRERVGTLSSNGAAGQSLPIDEVDEGSVQTDFELGVSGVQLAEREASVLGPVTQEPVKAKDQVQERDAETLARAKPASSPPATVESTSSLTAIEKSKAVAQCGPRQVTVRVDEPVRIACAALTLSILFDRQFDHEITTLRVAPDGQQLEQFPFFEHGAISPVVVSPAGRWRINVLSSSRADGQVVVAVSEEIHE